MERLLQIWKYANDRWENVTLCAWVSKENDVKVRNKPHRKKEKIKKDMWTKCVLLSPSLAFHLLKD